MQVRCDNAREIHNITLGSVNIQKMSAMVLSLLRNNGYTSCVVHTVPSTVLSVLHRLTHCLEVLFIFLLRYS